MDDVTRRNALKAGGVLGILGALWTWPAAGSIARAGEGADPRWVWDPEADPLLAEVIDRGDVPRVNELLRTWKKNGQPLPAGLPADVRDFVERARQLPSWADHGKLAASFAFTEKRGLYLGVLYGLASGMISTVIPHEARAVYYSKGGAAMKDRISKTAKLGYDVMTRNAFEPAGEMIVTCVKTRLVHAAVRHLLPRSPQWTGTADQTAPVSQRDLLVTWHSLPTTVMGKLTAWEIPIPRAESEGFLHSWQVTAHLLGIMDEYIPASWAEANAQAEQVLTPVLAPTDEGIALADILLNLGSSVDGGVLSKHVLGAFTRFTLGDRIAQWLRIPREPIWDPLLATAWGPFIAVREGLLPFPLAPAAYWTFDEFLRQAALLFLSEGRPISIEIPEANRPS
ncbi:oxygenase MpaB family protein [Amycolatopsis sp. cmx-4-68]|uniref:oxygenase MpaB family protein n=1 Tax=Amycolatopsis sp. cmx-4-68 TaxID=2790938 RepID=UPI00397E2367